MVPLIGQHTTRSRGWSMLNRFDARTYPRPLLDPDPADQDGEMYTGVLVAGRHDCIPRVADKVRRPATAHIGDIGTEPQCLLLNQANRTCR